MGHRLHPLSTAVAVACAMAVIWHHAGAESATDLSEIVVSAETPGSFPSSGVVAGRALESARVGTSDTAKLLLQVPGVSLYGAGGVPSLPAIHGLADDRVRIKVDGMDFELKQVHFHTPSGRVEFYVERLLPFGRALPNYEPPLEAFPENELSLHYPLVCLTEHSRYRVHSTFSNAPWLREIETEPRAAVHPLNSFLHLSACNHALVVFPEDYINGMSERRELHDALDADHNDDEKQPAES